MLVKTNNKLNMEGDSVQFQKYFKLIANNTLYIINIPENLHNLGILRLLTDPGIV